jgi:hypothetical protein
MNSYERLVKPKKLFENPSALVRTPPTRAFLTVKGNHRYFTMKPMDLHIRDARIKLH